MQALAARRARARAVARDDRSRRALERERLIVARVARAPVAPGRRTSVLPVGARGDRPRGRRRRAASSGSARRRAGRVAAEWDARGVPPLGDASRLPVANLAARRRTVAIADVLETPELDDGSSATSAASPSTAFEPSWRRRSSCSGAAHRRARASTGPAAVTGARRDRARRGRRPRGRARDPHRAPAARERTPARRAAGAAQGGGGAHERPPLRHRDRAPRRRAAARCVNADAADCWTLLARAATSSSAAQCSGCPRTRSADGPGRRHDRRRDRNRQARAATRLRRDRAASARRQLRGLRRGDGRADPLVRRDPRRARRRLARPRPLRASPTCL